MNIYTLFNYEKYSLFSIAHYYVFLYNKVSISVENTYYKVFLLIAKQWVGSCAQIVKLQCPFLYNAYSPKESLVPNSHINLSSS